jgi:hypothetical protein
MSMPAEPMGGAQSAPAYQNRNEAMNIGIHGSAGLVREHPIAI